MGNMPRAFLGPLTHLQTCAGKDVPKASVFPLLRIIETVKIEMPNGQHTIALSHFIRFNHRIRRTFDAIGHAQALQHIAGKGGFACTQLAMQTHQRLRQRRAHGQALGIGSAG